MQLLLSKIARFIIKLRKNRIIKGFMFTRQLIIQFLIVNILFSNFAWAIDECGYLFDLSTTEQITFQYDNPIADRASLKTDNLKQNNPDDNASNSACDVNCSANIRLLYVSFSLPLVHFTAIDSTVNSMESSYHSIHDQPPVKPPRA